MRNLVAGGRLILCKNFGFVLTLTPSVNGFGELQATFIIELG